MSASLDEFQLRLGYLFKDPALLIRALTHRSLLVELKADEPSDGDNEQLEFLGDAILGFIASDELVRKRPQAREGELSRLKGHLVSAVHLHEVALELGVGQHLLLGRGEELSGGRTKRALLSDALEAIIAAIYLDGGVEACRGFVGRAVLRRFEPEGELSPLPPVDPKSLLQEFAQSRKLATPRYSIVKEHGPEHAKTFTVEVKIGRTVRAQAEGRSKKVAGQKAAELALEALSRGAQGEPDEAGAAGPAVDAEVLLEGEAESGPQVDAGAVDA